MDSLSNLLQELNFNAEVFFSGSLCGLQAFEENDNHGLLHVLKSGSMTMLTDQGHEVELHKASVLFLPSGGDHRIKIKDSHEAELVCANIQFDAHQRSVLVQNLPKFICIDVEQNPVISHTADEIFEEAFNNQLGKKSSSIVCAISSLFRSCAMQLIAGWSIWQLSPPVLIPVCRS